ncbi:unnamed protein product [Lactuca saligna]|uniref:EGF-like domain-containing protein n=1 Tax=Lactuca saligna TaxID=75948 RepID=A0AA35ZBP9_LACSI|nr:unnamed protein product [Lactuca saligna]
MQSICQQEAGFCPFGPCSPRLSDSSTYFRVSYRFWFSFQARNAGVLACQAHTHCIDSDTGAPGYRCVCNQGYQGQPYLDPGCQDPNSNLCEGICTNTPGSYSCSCKDGYVVDEFSDGRGCLAKTSEFPVIKFSIGHFGDGRRSLEQYVFSTTYSGKPCGTDEQHNNSYMKMMTNVVGGGGAA